MSREAVHGNCESSELFFGKIGNFWKNWKFLEILEISGNIGNFWNFLGFFFCRNDLFIHASLHKYVQEWFLAV
jgi:hypothetical protein